MPFSTAYMRLNVWYSAVSNAESENRLEASSLLFINILELSDFLPVPQQHPILLDVISNEAISVSGEHVPALSLRSFRLHEMWTQPQEGEMVHHIHLPHYLGERSSSVIEYDSEKFPRNLMKGTKIAIDLWAPTEDHWNIASDNVLPSTMEDSRG